VRLPDGPTQRQRLGHAAAARQRAMDGGLDRLAVGGRIAPGNTDLDDVGARLRGGEDQPFAGLVVGVLRGQVDDQRGALARLRAREAVTQPTHSVTPRRAAMVPMSLSPRPETLTMTMAPSGSDAVIL